MIFVDTSALIAIAVKEPAALALARMLQRERTRSCSALSLCGATAGLCRRYMFAVQSAGDRLRFLRAMFGLQIMQFGEAEHEAPAKAYAQFGKGQHPGGLHIGDCLAHACTKTNRAALLFKGDDFSQTDMRIATAKE